MKAGVGSSININCGIIIVGCGEYWLKCALKYNN
jgi:hypothetical protein